MTEPLTAVFRGTALVGVYEIPIDADTVVLFDYDPYPSASVADFGDLNYHYAPVRRETRYHQARVPHDDGTSTRVFCDDLQALEALPW